jgi:hypothetical protein
LKRPARLFSFSDWNKDRPKEPPPGDRLDAQFLELIDTIAQTQEALREIRRDDGALKSNSVGDEQLTTNLREVLIGDIEARVAAIHSTISGIARQAQDSEKSAQLFAEDAERALIVARQMISDWNVIRDSAVRASDYAQRSARSTDINATEAEDWANYSKAQADNAIAAKDEALQWAEYLAGPVVDPAHAAQYIAESKFPNGLFYQPVEGSPAGLWSAKWWAIYARSLVGNVAFYYLGAWDAPPLPGETNPNTGQTVPNPLTEGSIYYDTNSGTIFVWNGTAWTSPVALAQGFVGNFVYTAAANQTVFSGPDDSGTTPEVGTSPSDVYVNGVRLIPDEDFTVAGDALTILAPLTAGSTVMWDLLVPQEKLAPGTVNAFKIKPITLDGSTQDFPLQYVDSGGATVDAEVGSGVQMQVSLDGCMQESGKDYTASGAAIHFSSAPPADASLWMIWYQPGSAA